MAAALLRSLGPLSGRPMPLATSASTWLWGRGMVDRDLTLGRRRGVGREEGAQAGVRGRGRWLGALAGRCRNHTQHQQKQCTYKQAAPNMLLFDHRVDPEPGI
jgi:hypothetical protein